MYSARYAETDLKLCVYSTLLAVDLSTNICVPVSGIESIVLPLHDGQTLPNLPSKDDAHQKQ